MKHQDSVFGVAFSPDGKTVLTGSGDKTARLWDATGRPLGQPMTHQETVYRVAFGPDGKTVLTRSDDKTARLWDATTGRPLGQPMTHQSVVSDAAFSPDGKTVLTGSFDKTARLWDATTGQPLGLPLTHQGWVWAVAFSPDGKTVLTGSADKTARLWDATTGQPLGPPLTHQDVVWAVAFSPGGKTVLTAGYENTARLWDVSELPDNLELIATWVQVITGLELEERGSVSVLDNSTWRERREQLEKLGGDPTTAPRWSLDPILFGPDPTARAKALIERKRWDEAEAEFAVAAQAWPLNTTILIQRGRFFAARSRQEQAHVDFARAYILGNRDPVLLDIIVGNESLFRRTVSANPQDALPLWIWHGDRLARRQLWSEAAASYHVARLLKPEDLQIRIHEILSLLAAGDNEGLRRARSDMLNRFHQPATQWMANPVAWYSVLVAGEEPNFGESVRLAELAVNGAPEVHKAVFLNTLGAALYRAGRFEEAVRRLDDGIQKRRGVSGAEAWVFLALAHHRLGHHKEARLWLDRFRDYLPDRAGFWRELEIRLLRSEAEAVILYDSIFPDDPFAH
jgi:tetratricopeptide (TPR) repeat protein